MSGGKLYVVATPIGNLGDMTARALETLRAVHTIAAEDTRRTRQLLSHFAIPAKSLVALHAHSTDGDVARIAALLEEGNDVAVVTDAGTPIVSDPGEALVRAAIAKGFTVVPIPGASAVLAALMASGLSENGFRFLGFLPRSGPPRHETITRVAETPETVVLFESPNRVQDTLIDLAAIMPARACVVARELTKMHEETVRGTLEDLAKNEREWIGEIVLVLGAFAPDARSENVDDAALDAKIDEELAAGGHAKSVAEKMAAWSGRPKRDVYARVLERKRVR
ncbi:MAG TPA: 16S rRNA (cytidine(1402)-2'-O)-methyltransferase [Polyangiaceae bacterium]